MPLAAGASHATLRQRFETENAAFSGLDWEIEDLLSDRLLSAFQKAEPTKILNARELGGRKHRDFTSAGKFQLREFAKKHASLEDCADVIRLIRALRDYHCLPIDHIRC
jgi:hypothetical protein